MRGIVCLGDVMQDVLAVLSGPLAHGSDTPARIRRLPGGSAANTAAWIAEGGVPVTLLGRVGDDEAGRSAITELEAAGVTVHCSRDPDRPTGTCLVLVSPGGERTMVPDSGANHGLGEAGVPATVITGARHLHVSGYSLLADPIRAVARGALRLAAGAGVPVSVGAASAAPLRAVGPATFLGWLPDSATLFANAEEATVLSGQDDPERAARTLVDAVAQVVVTLGTDGALALRRAGAPVRVPVPERLAVVDSTGAGDAFAAGYLAARFADDTSTEAALRAGAVLAARCVAGVGGRPLSR